MNNATSRRAFFGVAAGGLATLAGTLRRAFGYAANAGDTAPVGNVEAGAPDWSQASADPAATTYTYDRDSRLIAVRAPDDAVATTFVYDDA